MLDWLSEAQGMVVRLRPDKCAKFIDFQVTADDTKQQLPPDVTILHSVVRNLGIDGTSPGTPVQYMTIGELNSANPAWHTATGADEAKVWTYDDALQNGGIFYIYPKPASSYYLELYAVEYPAALSGLNDDIVVPVQFVPVLVDWIVYRALLQDASYGDTGKALAFKGSAYDFLKAGSSQPVEGLENASK